MTADGVVPALRAMRGERALVGLLVAAAALARMAMMAAMMLPSAIPTVALYAGMAS